MIAIPLTDMIVVNENDLFVILPKIANLVKSQNMRVCVKTFKLDGSDAYEFIDVTKNFFNTSTFKQHKKRTPVIIDDDKFLDKIVDLQLASMFGSKDLYVIVD